MPFVSMMRYARRMGTESALTVVASAQTRARLPVRLEELRSFGGFIALTRETTSTEPAPSASRATAPECWRARSDGIERRTCAGRGSSASSVGSLGEAGYRSDVCGSSSSA